MIVVDASVAVDVLLRTPGSEAVTARLLDSGEALHAPQLIDIEVLSVLRRLTAHAGLYPVRAVEAYQPVAPVAALQPTAQLRHSRVQASNPHSKVQSPSCLGIAGSHSWRRKRR